MRDNQGVGIWRESVYVEKYEAGNMSRSDTLKPTMALKAWASAGNNMAEMLLLDFYSMRPIPLPFSLGEGSPHSALASRW